MATNGNNSANVSVGKGVKGGYMFVAPAGTEAPTDNAADLDAAFMNLGYLGDSGISFSDSASTSTFRDLNGEPIENAAGDIEKSFTVTFREIKKDTLAVMMGSGNVTDAAGKLTAHDAGWPDEEWVCVLKLLLKNGRKWTRVAHRIKLSALGDMVHAYNSLAGRDATFTTLKDDESGDFYTDYIDSTESTATVAAKTTAKAAAAKTTAKAAAAKEV